MLQDSHGRKMETGCVQIQGLWYDNARPAGAGGTGAVGGRGRGRGGGDTGERARHVGGSMGLFGSNEWPCPIGGCAGGYKELDEEEIEETRRRRREADEVDDLLTFYGDLFSLIFGF
ncbi:transcription initiation factor TFIID subunit 15-like [Musa acuminata AAA Group]|uniref:transcription initiation factor TFIID subunit 15-like n=1 Tax=Musa acuminata AAA Group TaxID=214697 RepID=UPI0031DEDF6A